MPYPIKTAPQYKSFNRGRGILLLLTALHPELDRSLAHRQTLLGSKEFNITGEDINRYLLNKITGENGQKWKPNWPPLSFFMK